MQRTLEAEWLDDLAPNDPAAKASRRDLRIINAAMRNPAWFRRSCFGAMRSCERALEIGAGDGYLGASLSDVMPACDGLDYWPRPARWPPGWGWHQGDVLRFNGWASYAVVLGNLVFHHFRPVELAELGERIAENARLLIASEPARLPVFRRGFDLLCAVIAAGPVTRHDGRASIAAGFSGDELPLALGLDRHRGWQWRTCTSWTGANRLIAWRR